MFDSPKYISYDEVKYCFEADVSIRWIYTSVSTAGWLYCWDESTV